jgi:hypothetical protein
MLHHTSFLTSPTYSYEETPILDSTDKTSMLCHPGKRAYYKNFKTLTMMTSSEEVWCKAQDLITAIITFLLMPKTIH